MVNVIIPTYNEESSIDRLILSFYEDVVLDGNLALKLIIVNDGSTDRTIEIVEKTKGCLAGKVEIILLNHSKNMGLAEALKTGFAYCIKHHENMYSKDIVITMDADNTHPPALVLRMVRLIKEGADVVVGSRYRDGSRVIGLSRSRRSISWCASWFFRVFFPTEGIKDFTSGYRTYRMDVIKRSVDKYGDAFISEKGFSCMVDILMKLRTMGFVFVETPLILRYDRKEGVSKMKVAHTILETLKLACRRKLGKL